MSTTDEICETGLSQKGGIVLFLRGFVMRKDRSRGDRTYWECSKKKHTKGGMRLSNSCSARAVTEVIHNQHHLVSSTPHSHAPCVEDIHKTKFLNDIKTRAEGTRDMPCQIINRAKAKVPANLLRTLPSNDANRKVIQRIRGNSLFKEPTNALDLIVPEELKTCTNGDLFLLKDVTQGDVRVLIFSSIPHLTHLGDASWWISDGTFGTVPSCFYQLYSIHAAVGSAHNSRVLPLVYSLMTKKSEKSYKLFYESLIEIAEENGIILNPDIYITDFELAVINVTSKIFPDTKNKGCLFHWGQVIWRKVQDLGLAVDYGTDENFALFVRKIMALAFLKPHEVKEGFKTLQINPHEKAKPLLAWIDEYYVNGKEIITSTALTRNGRKHFKKPIFSADIWSVALNNELGIPRTSNQNEAWHRRWQNLIGIKHCGFYNFIEELKMEHHSVLGQIIEIESGAPRKKEKPETIEKRKRINNILQDKPNLSLDKFLEKIALNLKI